MKLDRTHIIQEIKACLHLAIPLAAAQLAQAATNFIDTVMMGWLGPQSLAAGGLGAITFAMLLLVGTGVVSAVGATVAIAHGEGNIKRVSRLSAMGLWVSLLLSIPTMLLIWYLGPILAFLGQEPSNVQSAQTYLQAIVWGFPAALAFATLKNILSALNHPRTIMAIMVSGVTLNVAGNYVLMFGKLGFPALGLAGIGWASTLSFWITCGAAVLYILKHREFKPYRIFEHLPQFDGTAFGDILQIGWPVGVLFAVESGLFTATAYLMGALGTISLAAHQIAIQTAAITFMVPVGISIATTMRVGLLIGQANPQGAKRAGYVGMGLGTLFMGITAAIFWLFPQQIVGIYLDIHNPENGPAIAAAIPLLGVAAIFQIVDGIQVIAAGALRGLKDTRIPMLIGIFAYWCVGFTGGYLLGLRLGWGGVGLWLGLALGLGCAAAILTWRFNWLVGRLEVRG
ncbi:MAG: MATE family efflux transporter [Desertifilum sp. SIO1I2]|nr:MATE family efflux transporter [Desertifilum sp. SIO1I2]